MAKKKEEVTGSGIDQDQMIIEGYAGHHNVDPIVALCISTADFGISESEVKSEGTVNSSHFETSISFAHLS